MAFFTRLILALLGMAFALLFTLGVLCWLALYLVFACLRWLLTGQKPQVVMMWQQIQAMRKGMQPRQGFAQRSDADSEVVDDVEVREIHDKRYLPKD
jgi:hypothetical protein